MSITDFLRRGIRLISFTVLRALAEGRIKWGFYPPDYDCTKLSDHYAGEGIWIENEDGTSTLVASDDEDYEESEMDSEQEGGFSEEELELEMDETVIDEDDEEFVEGTSKLGKVGGMFGALSIEDEDEDGESTDG